MKLEKRIKDQLNLSMPSAFDYIINALISMTDTFFVSSLGSEAIAAVGAMLSIIFFVNLGMKSVQVSNNVTVAHSIGENNKQKIKSITGNAVLLAIFAQILLSIITLIISPFIPTVFKVSNICLTYLYIRLIGTIPQGVKFVIAGYQRTLGKSKFVMNVNIISFILNGLLDYFSIKMNYGISGVAWSTAIVETISALILIIYSKKQIIYKLSKEYIRELINLVKFNIIYRVADRGSKLFLNIILSRIGLYEYAANVVLNRIEEFTDNFSYGFSIGITTTIGIAKGKNDIKEYNEVRKAINKIVTCLSIILPILITILLIILLPYMLEEPEALKIGYILSPLIVLYTFLLPIHYKYSSIIDGLKEFKFTSKLNILINILRVILCYLLCSICGIQGYWITLIIISIILIIIYKKKEKQIISIKF